MKRLVELVVRVADLVEAEGRAFAVAAREEGRRLREGGHRFAIGMAYIAAATFLLSLGLFFLVVGAILGLDGAVGRPAASAIVGTCSIGVAIGGLWALPRILR